MIYLYVKQHNITGLKYFGKTIRDPYKYYGSGKYWIRHLKKHGKDISTIEIFKFDDMDECTEFALKFSRENNIVDSEEWANLMEENGLQGGAKGRKYTPETIQKLKENHWIKNINCKEDHPNFGSERTQEQKTNISLSKKGKTKGENNHFYGKRHSLETKSLLSKKRKGSHINLKEEQKEAKLKVYKEILNLYECKVDLEIEYNYIAKNGRYFSYDNAFSKQFSEKFNMTTVNMMKIIKGKYLLLKEVYV